jgi:hypothetical protein
MRITIDLDGVLPLTLANALRVHSVVANLAAHYEPRSAAWRRSASGRGVHIVAWCDGIQDAEEARRILGDDHARIDMDMRRPASMRQTLWTIKRGRRAGEWRPMSELMHALIWGFKEI